VRRSSALLLGRASAFDSLGRVAEIAARSSFDTPPTAAVWRSERRLEDRASRIDAGAGWSSAFATIGSLLNELTVPRAPFEDD
jgi:hypothetical protein